MDQSHNPDLKQFSLTDWAQFAPTQYDYRDHFEAEMLPHIDAIYNVCKKFDIPFSLNICPAQTDEGGAIYRAYHIPDDMSRTGVDMLMRMPSVHFGAALVRQMLEVHKAGLVRMQNFIDAVEQAKKATQQ